MSGSKKLATCWTFISGKACLMSHEFESDDFSLRRRSLLVFSKGLDCIMLGFHPPTFTPGKQVVNFLRVPSHSTYL